MKTKHVGKLPWLLSAIFLFATTAHAQSPRVEFSIYPYYTRVWTLKGGMWTTKRAKLPFAEFAKLKEAIINSRQHPTIDPLQFGLTPSWWQSNSGRLQEFFGRKEPQVWNILTQQKLLFSYDDACYILKECLAECPRINPYSFDVKILDDLSIQLHSDCPTPFKFPWTVEYGSEKWQTCDASVTRAIDAWMGTRTKLTGDNWPDKVFDLPDLWQKQADKLISANSLTVLKALSGWNSAKAVMDLAQVTFQGHRGTAPPYLELQLLLRSPENFFGQLIWHAEFEQGRLKTPWDKLLAYCRDAKAAADAMGWVSRWKDGSRDRAVYLYAFNAAAGPNPLELEQPWNESGITGLPEFSFSLHEGNTPVAWILISKSQRRLMFFKFDDSGSILPITYRWKTFRGYMEVCDFNAEPHILQHKPELPAKR